MEKKGKKKKKEEEEEKERKFISLEKYSNENEAFITIRELFFN